jgi:histidine kinase
MKFIQERLGVKLFLSYMVVLTVGVVVLVVAVLLIAPFAYNRHMMTEGNMPMMGIGGQQGGRGIGVPGQNYLNFRAGIFEAITYAMLAAVAVALVVSFFFSRSIVAPLRAIMSASQRIAEGHYDERVNAAGHDELAQLAGRFNQMAGQLEQTETMRRRLIGDVSHELRTPLTGIKGYMEGLMDGVLPATPETFQQVFQEADRLSRLVDDLQELSRVESRAYQLDLRPLDAAALMQVAAKRLAHQFQAKDVELALQLPSDHLQILADEDRITQVLTNLLGNALQYTPAAGKVTVSVSQAENFARFSITDTGIGLPPEQLGRIFDRFYRVDKSRSRQAGGGSGIGLTIARHIVEAHGGRIWAESTGEGQGSSFHFTLQLS